MANFYGSSRTNYFRVKDEAAFEAFAEKYRCQVIRDVAGRVGLLPGDWTDDGTFPSYDPDEDEELDFLGMISDHLAEGSIAIIEQVGAEKLRYLSGYAEAIDHEGERVSVNISDIVDKARARFGDKADITDASY